MISRFQLFCVLFCLAASPVFTPAQARPASPFGDAEISVEINKGELVHLDRPAATVLIANPAIADVQVISPTLVSVSGRGIGETSLIAVDGNNQEIVNSVVQVTHNLSKLNATLKRAMPASNIELSSIDGALVMRGSVTSPLQASEVNRLVTPFAGESGSVVNMLKVEGSDQVMLQVRIAEVARTELKRFGISMENLLSPGNFMFGLGIGRDVVSDGVLLRSGTDNSLSIGHTSNHANINSVIDALEDQGVVRVLAQPNLTAISGKSASFLAGGEIPVPVVGEEQAVTIDYRPYGVNLSFTPVVMSEDKISLTVAPEVSALSQTGSVQVSGFTIPSFTTRRTQTTVELGSGQSFAIAGLLQNDSSNDISKFPGLGDVPVLGALFRSTEFRHDQTELVILVTPYIVRPSSDDKLALPTDNMQHPNDLERILLGKLYSENAPGSGGEAPAKAEEKLPVRTENSTQTPTAIATKSDVSVKEKQAATKPPEPAKPDKVALNAPPAEARLSGPAGFILK